MMANARNRQTGATAQVAQLAKDARGNVTLPSPLRATADYQPGAQPRWYAETDSMRCEANLGDWIALTPKGGLRVIPDPEFRGGYELFLPIPD